MIALRLPQVRRAPIRVLSAGPIAAGVLLGIGVSEISRYASDHPFALVAVAQLAVLAAVVAVVIVRRLRPDPFSPLSLFLILFPLMYTMPALLVRTGTDPFTNRIAPWLAHSVPLTVAAARWALIVEVAFLLGALAAYLTPRSARHLEPVALKMRSGSVKALHRANMLIAVGASAWLAFVLVSGGPANVVAHLFNRTQFLAGLNYLASGPILVCIGAAIRYFVAGRPVPSPWTATLFLAGVVMLLFTGSKANIAVISLVTLGIYHYRYRRIGWRITATIAVTGVAVLTLYNLYFRDAVPRNLPLNVVVQERGGFRNAATAGFSANSFFGHQALAIGISKYPSEQEFRGADSLRSLVGAPVPRRWWSSKPPAPSYDFTVAFAPQLARAGTTIPPTLAGEVYISWGFKALAPAFFLLGFGLTFLYLRRFRSPASLYVSICVFALLGHVLRGETFGGIVLLSLVLIPGLWALNAVIPADGR